MKFSFKSDLGKKRKINQDSCMAKLVAPSALLAVVCDGMGGSVGGEVASKKAIESFFNYIERKYKHPEALNDKSSSKSFIKNTITLLSRGVDYANSEVYSLSCKSKELAGMGTTLVAAFCVYDKLFCVNVGDSRMYYISDRGIIQCSHDHSYVQYLVDIGKLTSEEARQSMQRNIITRAVGIEHNVSSDVTLTDITLAKGGYILLSSDGLTNHLPDSEIFSIVSEREVSVGEKTDKLIARANELGGSDNISVVLIEL